jgi:hypothetical protein
VSTGGDEGWRSELAGGEEPDLSSETVTYRGRSLEEVLPRIREELGPDAIIERQRTGLVGGVGGFFQREMIEVDARAGASGPPERGGALNVLADGDDEAALRAAAAPLPDPDRDEGFGAPAMRRIVEQSEPFADLLHDAEQAFGPPPAVDEAPTTLSSHDWDAWSADLADADGDAEEEGDEQEPAPAPPPPSAPLSTYPPSVSAYGAAAYAQPVPQLPPAPPPYRPLPPGPRATSRRPGARTRAGARSAPHRRRPVPPGRSPAVAAHVPRWPSAGCRTTLAEAESTRPSRTPRPFAAARRTQEARPRTLAHTHARAGRFGAGRAHDRALAPPAGQDPRVTAGLAARTGGRGVGRSSA